MKIFVDADACPVVRIVERLAEKYEIPCTLLCDTNHILGSDYGDVVIVGAGKNIGLIAMKIIYCIFDRYQDEGRLPEKVSINY